MGEQEHVNDWRKSQASANGETCVEVGTAGDGVAVRDTTDQGNGPVLRVTPGDWGRFISSLS